MLAVMAAVSTQIRFFGVDRAGRTANVFAHGTQTPASLFDSSDQVTPISNPLTVSRQGMLNFAAAPGTYDVVDTGDGAKVVITLATSSPSPSQLNAAVVYTRATQPAATGSGQVIFVSDDGVGTLYKDTAVGVWTPLNPGEIAYAANVTGTATTSTNGAVVDVPGVAITVPASTRPVWLLVRGTFQQTVVGTGNVSLYVYETTGAATLLTNFLQIMPAVNGYVDVVGSYRLGPVASARSFKVSAVTIVLTGTPAAKTVNSAGNPTSILAEQR